MSVNWKVQSYSENESEGINRTQMWCRFIQKWGRWDLNPEGRGDNTRKPPFFQYLSLPRRQKSVFADEKTHIQQVLMTVELYFFRE